MIRRLYAMLACASLAAALVGRAGADSASASGSTSTSSTAPSSSAAPADPMLDGIKIGDDSAAVLARLGLHPPGWSRAPGSASEGRSFSTGDNKAIIVLVFDKTIESITVKWKEDGAQIGDAYGVKLGSSLTDLIALRGAPIAIDGDTYVFGDPAQIRWKYIVSANKVVSISVADCRVGGVCEP